MQCDPLYRILSKLISPRGRGRSQILQFGQGKCSFYGQQGRRAGQADLQLTSFHGRPVLQAFGMQVGEVRGLGQEGWQDGGW